MTNYPFQLEVNESKLINSVGEFLYYESASAGGADTSIIVITENNDQLVLKVGQGARVKKPFNSFRIKNNLGQGAIIGNLVIADGGFEDHRIVGQVEVIDGGKSRTLTNGAFLCGAGIGAVAGQYSHAQIFNPSNTGQNLFVESLIVSHTAAASMFLIDSDTLLPTSQSPVTTKKIGAASMAQKTAALNSATPTGGIAGTTKILYNTAVAANIAQAVPLREPILVPPGFGLIVRPDQLNGQLLVTFEGYVENQ